jgi:hypothetical protein
MFLAGCESKILSISLQPLIFEYSKSVSRQAHSKSVKQAHSKSVKADSVGLLDGAMHVWAVLYRATRIKTLCMEGGHWNQGE